jgi:hypothetical protein
MPWVKGQSGNPNGRKPGTLTKLRRAQEANLQVDGLTPNAMGLSIVKAMAQIALNPKEPKQLRIQAGNVVLPYCLPRLQVTAQIRSNGGDFSRARTKEELMEMVNAELGEGAVGMLQRVMNGLEKADDVIHAEVIPQPQPQPELAKAEPEQQRTADAT